MKSTTIFSIAALAATQLFGTALAATPKQPPAVDPIAGNPTSHGCYSSGGNLTKVSVLASEMSSGKCLAKCKAKYKVVALHGSECLCGDFYPAIDDVVKDSLCNFKCPAYPYESCGGIGSTSHYSVFNTGLDVDVKDYVPEKEDDDGDDDDDDKTTKPPAASKTAGPSSPAETSQAAKETQSEAPKEEEKKSSNTPAIAGGVVAGVAVIGGIVGVLFFMMRRKRNAEIEEEHRRNAAVNAFISGSKPPGSSDGISMTDSRLDPVLAHRRMSDGSIADNQDYSRRILRVTNA